jgi:uncharacterized membrane protein
MMGFWFFPFLLLLLLLCVPFMLARHAFGGGCGMARMQGMTPTAPSAPTAPAGKDPVDIVRERLARGEITPAEYEEIRKALG